MRWFVRMFFRTLRLVLTPVVLLWASAPASNAVERQAVEQQRIDEETKRLALYQFKTCPFCIKVRREIKRLALDIELHDAQKDAQRRDELLNGGGDVKVPCLRITHDDGSERWMYESADIIGYLQQRFA